MNGEKRPCTTAPEVLKGTVQRREYGTWSRLPSVKGALVQIMIQEKTDQPCLCSSRNCLTAKVKDKG